MIYFEVSGFQLFRINPIGGVNGNLTLKGVRKVSNYSELTQSVGIKRTFAIAKAVCVSNYSELTQSVGKNAKILLVRWEICFQLFRINPIGGEFV